MSSPSIRVITHSQNPKVSRIKYV